MKIIFLGTNGWYDTQTGNTVCVFIETDKEYIILDAGNGFYKIDEHIRDKKPIHLFFSHYHLDHIIGLHTLAKLNFSQGITIYGPAGLRKMFKAIINAPYSVPVKKLKTPIKLIELNVRRDAKFPFQFKRLKHSSCCYGYRFFLEDKIVSYCTDTGMCSNLFLLSSGADLLITECSLKKGQRNKKWPHLNPEDAAVLAKMAGVKRLVLFHFDASIYTDLAERKRAEADARKIFKRSFCAADDFTLTI